MMQLFSWTQRSTARNAWKRAINVQHLTAAWTMEPSLIEWTLPKILMSKSWMLMAYRKFCGWASKTNVSWEEKRRDFNPTVKILQCWKDSSASATPTSTKKLVTMTMNKIIDTYFINLYYLILSLWLTFWFTSNNRCTRTGLKRR